MGPRFKVSSDRLVKPGIEPATPDLQGKRFIHYTIAAAHATKWLFIYRRDFSTCSMVVWGGGGGGGGGVAFTFSLIVNMILALTLKE